MYALVLNGNVRRIIISCILPNKSPNEILCAKNFIAHVENICGLSIIDRNYHDTIRCQKIFHDSESLIDHAQPIGMKSAISVGVGDQSIVRLIDLVSQFEVFKRISNKIITINEVVPFLSVIWRIKIY